MSQAARSDERRMYSQARFLFVWNRLFGKVTFDVLKTDDHFTTWTYATAIRVCRKWIPPLWSNSPVRDDITLCVSSDGLWAGCHVISASVLLVVIMRHTLFIGQYDNTNSLILGVLSYNSLPLVRLLPQLSKRWFEYFMFFHSADTSNQRVLFFILQKFQNLIKDWPADLYSVQPIISAVQVSDQPIVSAVWGRVQPIISAIQATVQPIICTLPIISALQAAFQPMISTVQSNVQPIISILRMSDHAVKSAVHNCSMKGWKN